MEKKTASAITLTLLLTSMLTLAFNIQPVKAEGTIYIRADGSIDPLYAPIQCDEDIYTLTDDIISEYNGISIERSNIVLDGASHKIQGTVVGPTVGIFLDSGRVNVTVRNVEITDFENGILLYNSSSNCVVGNNVTENARFGIQFSQSSGNSIVGNNIIGNNVSGIYLDSPNNLIYHNNFIDNTAQVSMAMAGANVWDDGYPSGGNYWSDYNGSDLFLGENQDQLGSDGIGDTHYVIDGNNTDHYPLMNPWAPPDAAVLNITTSKRFIGEGYSAYLTAVVENQGGKVENLNTTVYVGQVNVTFQTFLLMGHNSLIHTFSWDSTGFSKGNYTLSTCVEPIEGEEDLADNTMYYDWVLITIPGDVSGDKTVNVLDAIVLSNAFYSRPQDPSWNPNADINNDLTVNILDAIILGNHFNQSWS